MTNLGGETQKNEGCEIYTNIKEAHFFFAKPFASFFFAPQEFAFFHSGNFMFLKFIKGPKPLPSVSRIFKLRFGSTRLNKRPHPLCPLRLLKLANYSFCFFGNFLEHSFPFVSPWESFDFARCWHFRTFVRAHRRFPFLFLPQPFFLQHLSNMVIFRKLSALVILIP